MAKLLIVLCVVFAAPFCLAEEITLTTIMPAQGGGVPQGAIIMWSGAIGDIPGGWQLCDGTNDTPDLRDRFVVGAGTSYTPNATGGEATHTLTIDEMPSHRHVLGTYILPQPKGGGSIADSAGSGGWTGYTGGGAAHENRPPYYALAYIMKL